eukprot:TRINITY_DN18216_c0_g1_i1.p1 TRINITY_DN18216_c0_g1~~TRINITY_DN18216_c0_g1_i1.p1  ORF type:complete len:235 (-),score=31.62 TRINITY_DN18216_c0_g1_i1:8-712(-)
MSFLQIVNTPHLFPVEAASYFSRGSEELHQAYYSFFASRGEEPSRHALYFFLCAPPYLMIEKDEPDPNQVIKMQIDVEAQHTILHPDEEFEWQFDHLVETAENEVRDEVQDETEKISPLLESSPDLSDDLHSIVSETSASSEIYPTFDPSSFGEETESDSDVENRVWLRYTYHDQSDNEAVFGSDDDLDSDIDSECDEKVKVSAHHFKRRLPTEDDDEDDPPVRAKRRRCVRLN